MVRYYVLKIVFVGYIYYFVIFGFNVLFFIKSVYFWNGGGLSIFL